PLRQLTGGGASLAALGLAIWLPTAADAADPNAGDALDEDDDDMTIIVSAEDGVPTVAGSAHVLDEDVLERMEHDDVTRILPTVPGVYVRSEDGYGLRPNIGIRGASSDRSAKITLLEDGIPLAPAPYAAPAAYYFPMSTRLVGMEVFKGPAAIQHGPQTVGGAINLRTRQVPDDGTHGALDAAMGLNQTVKVHGWAGTGGSRAGVLAEIVHLGTQGFKDLDGGGSTGFQRTEMMLKARSTHALGMQTHSQVELKLGVSREDSNESYLGLSADDVQVTPYRRYAATALDRMQWQRTQAHLSWDLRVGRQVQIRTTAYHHYLSRAWTKFNRFEGGPPGAQILQHPSAGSAAVFMAVLRGEEDSATDEQQLMIGTNDRRYHSAGVQSRVRWRVEGERVSALWEAGARLHVDDVVRLHTEDAHRMISGSLQRTDAPTLIDQDRHSTARAVAAHTHGDVRVGDLHLQPGARLEWIHTAEQAANGKPDEPQDRLHLLPGLGVLHQIGQAGALFAGAHRGFSPVSPGQSADALPEVSWNYELGARFIQGDRHAEAALFASDYQNLTGECTSSGGCTSAQVGQQFNAGRVLVAGLESAASDDMPLVPGLSMPLRASYTYSYTRFADDFSSGFPQFGDVSRGDRLPYVPSHQGTVSVGLNHDLFQLTVAAEARSSMLDTSGTELGDFDVPAILLMDVAAKVHIHGPLWSYLTVTNLTGSTAVTSWRPLGARPTAPRQVTVGLKLR
ncbi:MAG: Fe(3+) dicitrate transport protein, partial [Kiritimatiellia bacterium]